MRYSKKFLKTKSCDRCMYLGWTDGLLRCNYILHTKEPRGCTVENCTRKRLAPSGNSTSRKRKEIRLNHNTLKL